MPDFNQPGPDLYRSKGDTLSLIWQNRSW